MRPVLIDRAGTAADSEGVERIFTLEGLDELLAGAASPQLTPPHATLTETFETWGTDPRPPEPTGDGGRPERG